MRSIAAVVIPPLFLCSLVVGCGYSGELDDLTGDRLVDGGFGIGGVVVVTPARSDDISEVELADLMRTEIIEKRQDFKVVSRSYIERTLGSDTHQALMETYRRQGALSPAVVREIADALNGRFRYISLVNVHHDSVWTRVRPTPGEETATDYVTTREVRATVHVFDLYDLARHEPVLTVNLDATADRTITRRKHDTIPGTLPKSNYADPVGLGTVAAYLFDDFARQLPTPPMQPPR